MFQDSDDRPGVLREFFEEQTDRQIEEARKSSRQAIVLAVIADAIAVAALIVAIE